MTRESVSDEVAAGCGGFDDIINQTALGRGIGVQELLGELCFLLRGSFLAIDGQRRLGLRMAYR